MDIWEGIWHSIGFDCKVYRWTETTKALYVSWHIQPGDALSKTCPQAVAVEWQGLVMMLKGLCCRYMVCCCYLFDVVALSWHLGLDVLYRGLKVTWCTVFVVWH